MPLVSDFKTERAERRRFLAAEYDPAAILRRMKGEPLIGRDEDGKPVETRHLYEFGIMLIGWMVELDVYRNDKRYLECIPRNQADTLVRHGLHERKRIRVMTDIYRATRIFKHIAEKYREEWRTTSVVMEIERVNAMLVENPMGLRGAKHTEALRILRRVCRRINLKGNANKVIAKRKLEGAIESLESHNTSAAAVQLVAFRNKYSDWRDEEILRLGSKAFLKECAVRAMRDKYLQHMLRSWITSIGEAPFAKAVALHDLWALDNRLILIIDSAIPISDRIEQLSQNDFSCGRRILESAALLSAQDKFDAAEMELRLLRHYLSSNKPAYIAAQLEETADPYMISGANPDTTFIVYLKTGAMLFENRVFDRAKHCFTEALRILDSYDTQ